MSHPLRIRSAKWLGVIASGIVLILWFGVVLAKQSQYNSHAVTAGTWTIGSWIFDAVDMKMILLAAAGLLAAFFRKPVLIFILFLLMFYPVGLYTLGVPGWAKLIGISTLLFVCSGFLLLSTSYRITKI